MPIDRDMLMTAIGERKRVLVLTHNNPDPDALASACGLATIFQHLTPCRVQVAYGGIVGRSENRTLFRYLPIDPTPFGRIRGRKQLAYALVDTQPGAGNNALPLGMVPAMVVDHHPRKASTRPLLKETPIVDIRTDYGACSTIIAEYLQELEIPISASLATALVYGITSETQSLGREATKQDLKIFNDLIPLANLKNLSMIEFSRQPREYFRYVRKAVDNAFFYKNVIGTRLGEIGNPDMVAEMADFLLRHERMSWSIVTGLHQEKLLVSIRAMNQKARAGRTIRRLVEVLGGTAGGHNLVAGGQLDCKGKTAKEITHLDWELIVGFIKKVTNIENIKVINPLVALAIKDPWEK
ncbi:MAG: DHH family phosphoesterase [Deltaproteobacteria bacterium]|nr:DHH family phosphoesterase [Candidatus Anaeroferrophillus wilburensis]MBN2889057.1 DHH family phosphoesterase [Deltaproteobacteria bacterium]